MKRGCWLIIILITALDGALAVPLGWQEFSLYAGGTNEWEVFGHSFAYQDSNRDYHVAFTRNFNSGRAFEIFDAKIVGNTFTVHDITPYQFGSQTDVQVAPDPRGFAYFIWSDDRNVGFTQIYMQKVDNNGNRLLPSDLLVSSNQAPASASSPTIAIDRDKNVYIVWADNRNRNLDLYLTKLDQFGSPYPTIDNKQLTTDARNSNHPSITLNPTGDSFNLVWIDDRDRNTELYFARFDL